VIITGWPVEQAVNVIASWRTNGDIEGLCAAARRPPLAGVKEERDKLLDPEQLKLASKSCLFRESAGSLRW